ncbi:MAG: ABC transporter permease [Rhizomicrobium sp.]
MFRNYLTVALRNASRNRLYSFITIAGLTVALVCAIFILLFLSDELSYDSFIPDMGNVYRVDMGFYVPGHTVQRGNNNIFALGPAMKASIPQVVAYTHISDSTVTLKVGNRLFSESVDAVDPDFFKVIPLKLSEGNPSQVFTQPDSVVLSQREARKLFGTEHVLGKTVVINGSHPMTVTGVLQDLPHNTQLVAKVLFPNTSKADPMKPFYKRHWESFGPYLYVRLAAGSDPTQVLAMTRHLIDQHINMKKDWGVDIPASQVFRPHLTPFWQGHLSPYGGGMTPGGSWLEVYGFAVIATLILLMAGFNFTNLATAQAMLRAREVSLRKVLGARRGQLILQFLGESVLTALLSLLIALGLVELLTPAFDHLLGRTLSFQYFTNWPLTLLVIAAAVVTGLVGGFYPALVLSAFRPATTLRAGTRGGRGSGLLRNGLVVLQFALSIGLGIAAIVIFTQIHYVRDVALGFDRSHIYVVRNAKALPLAKREDFARAVATLPSVEGDTLSRSTPFDGTNNLGGVMIPGSPRKFNMRYYSVDPNYFRVYHVHLLAGRLLSFAHALDHMGKATTQPTNVVISLAAARLFGYGPEEALGKILNTGTRLYRIVGVVANQHLDGPTMQVDPIIFQYDDLLNELSVRIRPGQTSAAVDAIHRIWRGYAPNSAINARFLDDTFNRLFKAAEKRSHMFAIFVGIAISIACLGLYGLAAFAAQRRTREIGVRKVFGARAGHIVRMLLWQFSVPVLIANLIAWPIAWYYLNNWLEGFAQRIWLNPGYFAGAGLIALLIAWATVIAHARRAANSSPVRALRYE